MARIDPMQSPLEMHVKVRGKTESEVVTCEEAAFHRGIPLSSELKTLLVMADSLIFVNLCGDQRLSLRKLKNTLDVEQAYIVGKDFLKEVYGLSPGQVTPLVPEIWNSRNICDPRVFAETLVYTNDGSKTGFIGFEPSALRSMPSLVILEIAK